MIQAVVLTHGQLGEALLNTAQMILGNQHGVNTLSSANRGPVELYQQLESTVKKILENGDDVIIFVDLFGGNTWNVGCKVAHDHQSIAVIAGINLGMLLSFCTKREGKSLNELTNILVQDGKRHVVLNE